MSDLGELLGTLMVSLARARQIADAQTAAIAEWYKQHPLLEGIGVPRIRVPEMVIEVPVLLHASAEGVPNQLADPEVVARTARAELAAAAGRAGVDLAGDVLGAAAAGVATSVADLRARAATSGATVSREAVARAAEAATARVLAASPGTGRLAADRLRDVLADVRRRVEDAAEVKPGQAPTLSATLMTSEVKEKADPLTVTRIRLTLREEGLEWSSSQASDGTSARRLTPE